MSEQHGRDWTRMTPDDFDQDAPVRPVVPARPTAVPAVPDEYGTPPLFGDETPAARPRTRKSVAPPLDQPKLF
ncbi:hypothetical protein ACFU96_31655 [Streptomyces sp. NPDC057620]|uniref:Uncharacterized protein n=1 Tax=Streptomyces liliiviolaceus TaxID=2823109 RepID=A0A940Y7P8_9ACTN|nr:hypothetical protein [Streptomyces liliiviolaceus]MBQ0854721.1 hypothetical protein [Streptomyces liliiviolaceus]